MRHPGLSRRAVLTAGGGSAVATLFGVPRSVPAAAAPAVVGPVPAVASRPGAGPATGSPVPPERALARLLAGNRRFARGRARHPRQGIADLRRLASGQRPYAVTLGCADSRVPPELLFDQGLGDLFDNRVAGNLVDDLLADSVAYALREFDCRLVLVLGHERCGAVTATVEAIREGCPGSHGPIVEALWPIVEPALALPGDPVENGVRANVRAQARALRRLVGTGGPLVVGARYDLDTGRVTVVDTD